MHNNADLDLDVMCELQAMLGEYHQGGSSLTNNHQHLDLAPLGPRMARGQLAVLDDSRENSQS